MENGKMKIHDFIDHGILYEINRVVLHPLGLAMTICVPEDPQEISGTFQVQIARELAFESGSDQEELRNAFTRFRENHKEILTDELNHQGIRFSAHGEAHEECSRPDPLTLVMQWAFNVTASSFKSIVYDDLGNSSYVLSKFKLMQESFGMWWLELEQSRKQQVLTAVAGQG